MGFLAPDQVFELHVAVNNVCAVERGDRGEELKHDGSDFGRLLEGSRRGQKIAASPLALGQNSEKLFAFCEIGDDDGTLFRFFIDEGFSEMDNVWMARARSEEFCLRRRLLEC